jgi:hypothetical protein
MGLAGTTAPALLSFISWICGIFGLTEKFLLLIAQVRFCYRVAMLVPLLALTMMQHTLYGQEDMSKGSGLYHACQTAIRVHESPSVASQEDHYFAGTCDIYFSGFIDAELASHGLCATGVSVGGFIKTYVAFMENNSQYLSQHKALGLLAALHDSYPCPAKK